MYNKQFIDNNSFHMHPFKDRVFVLFNDQDLKRAREYLDGLEHENGYDQFDKLDTNYGIATIGSKGTANVHVVYLPIIERQGMGIHWMYMHTVITRMMTDITLKTIAAAGYNPLTQPSMYIHLLTRSIEHVMRGVERKFGGKLTIGTQASMALNEALTPQQWDYVDQLVPRCIADLARQQVMLEDNHVVQQTSDGWSSTSYYY